jgi:hypothetical protein
MHPGEDPIEKSLYGQCVRLRYERGNGRCALLTVGGAELSYTAPRYVGTCPSESQYGDVIYPHLWPSVISQVGWRSYRSLCLFCALFDCLDGGLLRVTFHCTERVAWPLPSLVYLGHTPQGQHMHLFRRRLRVLLRGEAGRG